MTAQTSTPEAPLVTPMGDDDIREVARHLFSMEVQGSRLDLMSYDTNKSQQKAWFKVAKHMVRRLEADGHNVTIER